jgi:hypothetical protein
LLSACNAENLRAALDSTPQDIAKAPFLTSNRTLNLPTAMRFGLNTFLYTSPFTTESVKLFPKFKKWGFETIEIPVEALEHIDPAKVKAAADKNGWRWQRLRLHGTGARLSW